MNAAEIIKKDLDAIYIGNLSTVDAILHSRRMENTVLNLPGRQGKKDLLTIQERYIVRCMAWETVKLH